MREQQRQPPAQELEPPSTGAPIELLQRARNSDGDARLELAGRLNALLRQVPAEAEREGFAQFVVEKLDDEGFHDLYDGDGVSCRAVAVEAVLALGFPYALHLTPTDLEYLRSVKPAGSSVGLWGAMALVTGVLVALFALAFFIHL
ncbi:MAG: hypothetical protein IPJ65_27245 [Archangiaceae bacterium]|nr:hypothetical protein [Archangiaceae bacterium]